MYDPQKYVYSHKSQEVTDNEGLGEGQRGTCRKGFRTQALWKNTARVVMEENTRALDLSHPSSFLSVLIFSYPVSTSFLVCLLGHSVSVLFTFCVHMSVGLVCSLCAVSSYVTCLS